MKQEVLTLDGCLSRQSDRKQMGVVAYDRRTENVNFGEQLANLTPMERLRCALIGACAIVAGGFGALVVVEALKDLTAICLKLSHWL